MQTALLISSQEWQAVLSRLERLEQLAQTAEEIDSIDAQRLLTTGQAATYLNVHPESIRRARREKRLTAERINERDYGFRKAELDRYTKRHSRL